MAPVLEMKGITRKFPGVLANDRVDFSLEKGEIHALLGENGAGKSTLMNILYGLYRPDAGEILLHGRKASVDKPSDAIGLGIGMVHQHFMLVPVMTVIENMIVGNEVTRFSQWLDLKGATEKVRELSSRYGLEIDPNAVVGDLPVGVRQRVEILKALYRDADILILDEPTAVLTPDESESLFQTLSALKTLGKSIVFITHKLNEVMSVADRITILRNGRVVGVERPGDTSETQLATMTVGREVAFSVRKKPSEPGPVILKVRNLEAEDDRGVPALSGVSLDIRAGEILGLAGVQGNGQTELVEILTGLRKCSAGSIAIDHQDITNRSPRFVLDHGVAHIPEDRHTHGMVESFAVADNLILNTYRHRPFAGRFALDKQAVMDNAAQLIEEFDIRTPSLSTTAGSLSGGNQQKMVIAREFSRPIQLLIAAQPTRGLDVGSTEFIRQRIVKKRDEGCAVLLVSAELDEILALSDRIAVMVKGEILTVIEADEADRGTVGLWMAGVGQ